MRLKLGFTLVEVLVVVGVLCLLVGLVLPALVSAQHRAYTADDANRLRQMGQAMAIYVGDNGSASYRCATLVNAGLVPKELCGSHLDPTSRGIANIAIVDMAEGSTAYKGLDVPYKLSYLGIADFVLSADTTKRIEEEPGSGWLVNVARGVRGADVSPSPYMWSGKYDRLLFDGSVHTQTFVQYRVKAGSSEMLTGSPIFLYCEPNKKWLQELTTYP